MDPDGFIRELASRQHGALGRKQLTAGGITESMIRRRLDSGMLESLGTGVLRLSGSTPTEMQRASAAVLDAPGPAFLSHRSAAAFWRFPGFSLTPPIHVVIPWKGITRRTRLSVVHFHRGLPEPHLLETSGLRVVSPALAVFLMAGTEPAGRTERALDNGLSMRLFTNATMHSLLKELGARGRNGIGLMRRLLKVRPAGYIPPQSGLEARVERLASEVGAKLTRQVHVGDEEWIGRVDFTLDGTIDVIEVLSERYHSALLDRQADEKRFERLRQSGRRVLTLCDTDVWGRPEYVRQQILSFWRGEPVT